jgi:NADPH:quinone reductase
MKAVWYDSQGDAAAVLKEGTLPDPEPAPGEVRVRLHASAVNPTDTKVRSGWRGTRAMPFPRIIPHQDGAGVIDRVGPGVDASRIGQRVWVFEAQYRRPFGTAAEYTVVSATNAVPLPENTSFAEGACLGIPAMTAHRCLFMDGAITGQTLLVTGGAGAVGFYAVQLARWGRAARVFATVSRPEQAEIALAAGADTVINYKSEDVAARLKELAGAADGRGTDRVIDVNFAANVDVAASVLKPNGVVATYASGEDPRARPAIPFFPLMLNGVTVHFVLEYVMPVECKAAAARDITAALAAGALRHNIGRRFPLSAAGVAAAHDLQDSGTLIGKALIETVAP